MEELIVALTLGLVQGLLEWLPVSSSGHVLLLSSALGIREAYELSMSLHLGTACAAAILFKREFLNAARQALSLGKRGGRELRVLLVSTLLTAVLGLPVYLLVRGVEEASFRWLMLLVAASLFLTAAIPRSKGGVKAVSTREAVALGLAQGAAALPGLSRSGITLAVLLALGVEPKEAVRWSVIAGVPVAAGAALLSLTEVWSNFYVVALGNLAAFLSGLISAKALLEISKRFDLSRFAALAGLLALLSAALS